MPASARAARRFVLLMDADVQITPDTIPPLHAAMVADPTIGVGQPDRRAPRASPT